MNKNRKNKLLRLLQAQAEKGGSLVSEYLDHKVFATLPLDQIGEKSVYLCTAKYIGTNSLERGEFLLGSDEKYRVSTALKSQFSGLSVGDKVDLAITTVPPRQEGQQPLVSVYKVFVD